MGEAQQSSGAASLKPESDVRAVPFVAGVTNPLRLGGRFIGLEPQPIDGGTVEET